jgi:hypothetical protein
VQPKPELLALTDPWDPKVDPALRTQDMVLYGGHYYLYFGAAPAALLFAPWRAVVGHDLPQNFAICILCFGGFLFSCAALLRVLELAERRPGPALMALLFLALGVCQSAPFLLNRADVYEIAIASGYFFLSGGVYFLSCGRWAASGVMFGLAVASRPHLALAGLAVLAVSAMRPERRRGALRFAAAFAVVGVAIGLYNFERFGNPLEFGFRYQLAGAGQNRVELGRRNLVPGVYYMLLDRPQLGPVFPWMRMVFRFPFDSADRHPLPPDYFVEPTVGALWIAPFLPLALFVRRKARPIVGAAAAGGILVLLFLISTHLATHRYEVDFTALLVFAAAANLALMRRRWIAAAGCVLIVYSAAANLALALAGPYDTYRKESPQRFVRLARHFSPSEEHRPMLNPQIALRMTVHFVEAPVGYREPLVTMGEAQHGYFLYAVRGGPTMRLVSRANDQEVSAEIPEPGNLPVDIALAYAGDHAMTVWVRGAEAIRQDVGILVTAPSQVAVAENYSDMGLTGRRFTGQIAVVSKTVAERRP